MIIDLDKNRREYFRPWTSGQISRQFVGIEEGGNLSLERDLPQIEDEDKLVVGTIDGSLEKVLDFVGEPDWTGVPRKILDMDFNELLLLPQEYFIPGDEAQASIYSTNSLVMADSMAVKRALIGDNAPKGRLSLKRKEQEQWAPERVLTEMMNQIYLRGEELAGKPITEYGWWGTKDNTRRVCSLYRNYEGLMIRAFQNLAYFNDMIKVKNGKKGELSSEEKEIFSEKLDKYMPYVERVLKPYLKKLKTTRWDLIEPIKRNKDNPSFDDETAVNMRVPSMSRLDEFINGVVDERRCYVTTLLNMAVLKPGDPKAYGAVWEIDYRCECKDDRHRSNRRKTRGSAKKLQGLPIKFPCKHVPSTHANRQSWFKENYKKGKTSGILEHSPYLFPMGKAPEYIHKLLYQTLAVVQNESGNPTLKPLNVKTMDRLLFDLIKVTNPYEEQYFTTDLDKFKSGVDDPYLDLIKFRND